MHFKFIILIVIFFSVVSPKISFSDETTDLLDAAEKKSEKIKIVIPENKDENIKKSIEETDTYLNSSDFLNRVEEERKKITGFFGYEEPADEADINEKKPALGKNERIYIFISSSIPRSTLIQYVSDLDHLNEPNIIICIRGFVDGMEKVKPTLDFINSLVKKDPSCSSDKCEYYKANIDIDPLAFRYFQIDKVPAVAFAENTILKEADRSIGTEDNIKKKGNELVIYGDVPLIYSLSEIEKEYPSIAKVRKKLERRGFYNSYRGNKEK